MFAARYYAQAEKADSAAITLNQAFDYGMTNPNVISKYPDLELVKSSFLWEGISQRLKDQEKELGLISNFEVNTDSFDSFWPYFQEALRDTLRAKEIFTDYIVSGPDAVRDYYAIRYFSVDNMYNQMIRKASDHYQYTRRVLSTNRLDSLKTKVARKMQKFSTLYPSAVFPKVYVVPGILNTGGTITNLGLFIGGEMFVKTDSMSNENLNPWQRNAISDSKQMPYTILHELMHFQQNYRDTANKNTVLAGVINEGVCDFLVELCSGRTPMQSNVNYLSEPENLRFILSEFRKELLSNNLSNWMYGKVVDRPTDIGYTLGYLICKSYYERSEDKQAAIYQLLNSDNFEAIFRKSKYGSQ